MYINGYGLKSELKNDNSGFSKWGFAVKDGKEFFVKELISPVYPINEGIMTRELFMEKRRYCSQYEEKYRNFYSKINEAGHGNLVRIEEFFRYGGKYYLITEKIDGESVTTEHIAALEERRKILFLKTVAKCFCDLHSAGIVHFDVKPNNIMIKTTRNGNYTAKLIDFDSGFLKGEILEEKELGGDLTYLAPETFLAMCGENVVPDEKTDIFALGLVFHEYWCGNLPIFNADEYGYPYEVVLDGDLLFLDTNTMPDPISNLISSMLLATPSDRPSSAKVMNIISEYGEHKGYIGAVNPEHETDGNSYRWSEAAPVSTPVMSNGADWFSRAGDL